MIKITQTGTVSISSGEIIIKNFCFSAVLELGCDNSTEAVLLWARDQINGRIARVNPNPHHLYSHSNQVIRTCQTRPISTCKTRS